MDRPSTQALIAEAHRLIELATRSGVNFLLADIDLAFTMLQRAQTTHDDEIRRRNLNNVRQALEVVEKTFAKLDATPAEHDKVLRRLRELRQRFEGFPG